MAWELNWHLGYCLSLIVKSLELLVTIWKQTLETMYLQIEAILSDLSHA